MHHQAIPGLLISMAASNSLPKSDSPELHLVVATPEEAVEQQHANSVEWRGALSLPAYLRREEVMADQALTRDEGLTVWVLVYQPAGSDESDRQVLCGCETIKKRGFVASNGVVEAVTAHGVCSVFCPAKHRGKGYAGRMMAELGERLKTWQSQGRNNLFSVLYSDIGKVCPCRFSHRLIVNQAHRFKGLLCCKRLEGLPVLPHFR